MSLPAFLPVLSAITLIMYHSDQVFFDYQTYLTINDWCAVDTDFYRGVMSLSVSFAPIHMANTIALEGCNYAAIWMLKV